MSERTDIPIYQDEPDVIGTFDEFGRISPRGPKVFVPKVKAPVPPAHTANTPALDGRICILDSDQELTADLREVLEAMGHEVLIINEIIGASNRIRAFSPEVMIIDAATTALPGPKLIEVLHRNLGGLPPIIFFTDMTRTRLCETGLGEYEWHPKSRGFLTLVNRIRVLLMYARTEHPGKAHRA